MKALVLCLALIGCTPTKAPRNVELTLHADTSFTDAQQQDLVEASKLWAAYTHNRARFHIVFDIEGNIGATLDHAAKGHHAIHRVDEGTSLANAVDVMTGAVAPIQALAATRRAGSGRIDIFFVDQRIAPGHFFNIAAHELGHAIGFDDIADPDSIMAGMHVNIVNWPSAYDRQLCKTARYCDE